MTFELDFSKMSDEDKDRWLTVRPAGGFYLHYDMEGRPCSLYEWVRLYESEQRFLKDDYILSDDGHVIRLSTIYEGLDSFLGVDGGIPLIYETALFFRGELQERWRHPTKQSALDGHAQLYDLLQYGPKMLPRGTT